MQRAEVKAVVIAALGRVLAAPVAPRPGGQEVFDRRADDVAALRAQHDGELVSQRGLARGGRSVDGDPRRVRGRDGPDRLGEAAEQLVAGPVVHGPPVRAPDALYRLDISNRYIETIHARVLRRKVASLRAFLDTALA